MNFDVLTYPEDCEVNINGNDLFLKKFNWEYSACLKYQKSAQEFVQKNRKAKIYIFTNHPHVFTMGRGNERGIEDLKDFTPDEESKLTYPLFNIHRGGGLTFHYPGQWIFYPIVAINESYTLSNHTDWLLKSVRDVLSEDFGIKNVITANKLMGVWKDRSKFASIGVGLSKFVTEHGLALNINYDKDMFDAVHKTNPCGIAPTTYITVDSQVDDKAKAKDDLLNRFHNAYIEKNFKQANIN